MSIYDLRAAFEAGVDVPEQITREIVTSVWDFCAIKKFLPKNFSDKLWSSIVNPDGINFNKFGKKRGRKTLGDKSYHSRKTIPTGMYTWVIQESSTGFYEEGDDYIYRRFDGDMKKNPEVFNSNMAEYFVQSRLDINSLMEKLEEYEDAYEIEGVEDWPPENITFVAIEEDELGNEDEDIFKEIEEVDFIAFVEKLYPNDTTENAVLQWYQNNKINDRLRMNEVYLVNS